MTNESNENLLELFYKDQVGWSYKFQNYAYITRLNRLKKAINEGLLKKDELLKHLSMSYGCNDGEYDLEIGNQYLAKINCFLDDIFIKIVDRNWTDENIFNGFNLMGYRIMNSLRDTDDQLILELK